MSISAACDYLLDKNNGDVHLKLYLFIYNSL